MRRKLVTAGIVLLALLGASTVRVSYYELGWGSYWAVDLVSPSSR